MTAPEPKTVREIARDCITDYIDDARDIAAHVMGHFGIGVPGDVYVWTDAVRADLSAAVVSWPDEQLLAEATGGEQQPWPRTQRMPLAVVGGRPQPWHHQAIAEYGAATGTELEPNPTIPGGYTATQINWAITWWNERVEAEQAQAGEAAKGIARFLTHFREDSDDTVIEGLGRYCLTVGMLRAVLAEREADTRAVARCQRAKAGPDAVPAMLALDARFADRIEVLDASADGGAQ